MVSGSHCPAGFPLSGIGVREGQQLERANVMDNAEGNTTTTPITTN